MPSVFTVCLLTAFWSGVIFGSDVQSPKQSSPQSKHICRGTPSASGVCSYAGELPFLVSIQMSVNESFTHICSGSIFGPSKVFTTGSCFRSFGNVSVTSLRVVAGMDNLVGTWDQIRSVGILNIHPNFTGTDFDYAVLSMSTDFEFNNVVHRATLAGDAEAAGVCVTAGWRLDVTLQDGFNQLQSAYLDLIEHSVCRAKYSDEGFQVHDRIICAHQLGKIAHNLDDGGPFLCDSTYQVLGAATYPKRGSPGQYPSFFASTAKAYDWIMSA